MSSPVTHGGGFSWQPLPYLFSGCSLWCGYGVEYQTAMPLLLCLLQRLLHLTHTIGHCRCYILCLIVLKWLNVLKWLISVLSG